MNAKETGDKSGKLFVGQREGYRSKLIIKRSLSMIQLLNGDKAGLFEELGKLHRVQKKISRCLGMLGNSRHLPICIYRLEPRWMSG